MMTASSAYALFRENEVGSLTPGKLADLLVVTGNPISSDPEEIFETTVVMTMINGEVAYCGENRRDICPGVDPG